MGGASGGGCGGVVELGVCVPWRLSSDSKCVHLLTSPDRRDSAWSVAKFSRGRSSHGSRIGGGCFELISKEESAECRGLLSAMDSKSSDCVITQRSGFGRVNYRSDGQVSGGFAAASPKSRLLRTGTACSTESDPKHGLGTSVSSCTRSKKWSKNRCHWMRYWKRSREDRCWRTIPTTGEEHVVC